MKLIPLQHLTNGRIYRLRPAEIDAFYNDSLLEYLRRKRPPKGNAFGLAGTVLLKLLQDGEIKDARMGANLVVDAGRELVIDLLQQTGPGIANWQAMGSDSTAAAAGQTALGSELGTREQGTIANGGLQQPFATTDRLATTFDAGNATGNINEVGRFNASSGGIMLARFVVATLTKGPAEAVLCTHDISIL